MSNVDRTRTRMQQLQQSQQLQQPEGCRFVPDTILPGYQWAPQWVPARTPTVHWGPISGKALGGPNTVQHSSIEQKHGKQRIKLPGGVQDLRTSTLIRQRPIRGESHVDFLGESAGSLPQPHDSFPDASEAINDFWSMSENFLYRHHVEPRVKLYPPREDSFPIPMKYIDVSRTTHTNLDVKQERRIDDYWSIDGSRDLSDSWTGFTQFTQLKEKIPDG